MESGRRRMGSERVGYEWREQDGVDIAKLASILSMRVRARKKQNGGTGLVALTSEASSGLRKMRVAAGRRNHDAYIAACSMSRIIVRRDVKGFAPLYRMIRLPKSHLEEVVGMDFSPQATHLVYATLDGTIHTRSMAHLFEDEDEKVGTMGDGSMSLESLVQSASGYRRDDGTGLDIMQTYRLGSTNSAIEVCKWWRNQRGQDFALVAYSDGMLTFVNLRTKMKHVVRGRRASIKNLWLCPLQPAGSVALAQSSDGSYHLIPLELPQVPETGSLDNNMGSGHPFANVVGLERNIINPENLYKDGKNSPLMRTKMMGETKMEWLVEFYRSHRFRMISLKILSHSRHASRLSIQWYALADGIPEQGCIGAFDQVTGTLRLYSIEALVACQALSLPKPLAAFSVPPNSTNHILKGAILVCHTNKRIWILSTALARRGPWLLDSSHPEAKRFRAQSRERWKIAVLQTIDVPLSSVNLSVDTSTHLIISPRIKLDDKHASASTIYLWGGMNVWELSLEGKVCIQLYNHLLDCPQNRKELSKWWELGLRLWWVGVSAGFDVFKLCEQAADELILRHTKKKAALYLYSLSRAPLRKIVQRYLSLRDTDGLVRIIIPLLTGRAQAASIALNMSAASPPPLPPPRSATAKQLTTLSDVALQCLIHKTITHTSSLPASRTPTPPPLSISQVASFYPSHEKPVEEEMYRFVNQNDTYSARSAFESLIDQLPSDFGLGAALEIARCREQKRACIFQMATRGVLDLSPSDFGSLISKDYTTLILHTTDGGAIFRSLPGHQKFQMLQMQLSEWEDMENRVFLPKSRSMMRFGFGEYVRVVWSILDHLDQPWLDRLAKFLDPSERGNISRFKDSGCEREVITLYLVTLLRLQYLREKAMEAELKTRELMSEIKIEGEIPPAGEERMDEAHLTFIRGQGHLEAQLRKRYGQYDTLTVLYRALDWENYEGASVVYEVQARWPDAIECRLFSKRTESSVVLAWVRDKISLMNIHNQNRLIPLVLRYWVEHDLPVGPLEDSLLSVFAEVATSLGFALFGGEDEQLSSPDSDSERKNSNNDFDYADGQHVPRFSWRLYTRLVSYGVELQPEDSKITS